MKKEKIIGVILIIGLLTGCASIISDSKYPVTISSSPTEADFTVTNSDGAKIHSGQTPATITLESGDGYFSSALYTVTFKKEGYVEKTTKIEGTMDGWYIGNLLFGGILGFLVIDPATGAMWKLPNTESVSLDSNVSSKRVTNTLNIVSIESLTDNQKEQLIEVK